MADRLEGSGASQLVQLIQQIGFNTYDEILLATVTAAPPALKIQVDGMKIELDADDIVIAQQLTKHTRKMKITSTGTTTLYSDNVTGQEPKAEPRTAMDIYEMQFASSDLTVTDATVEYLDELKVGDRVIVSSMNNGQTYVILDKAVQYGA